MRQYKIAFLAVLGVAMPVWAAAQGGTTTGTTPTPTTTSQPQTTRAYFDTYSNGSHWTLSGFVGSDFAQSVDGASVNFGGSLGYLYRGAIGAEFLAGFAPDFRLRNNLVFGSERPQVNSYMFNLMGAVPFGGDERVQPFVSAGLGAITLGSNHFNNDDPDVSENTLDPDDAHFGGNIGGGIMAFMGNWGVRGDVRYFRAFKGDALTPTGNPPQDALNNVLPGLDFWRATIGVAARW
jgi:hypothetical protein